MPAVSQVVLLLAVLASPSHGIRRGHSNTGQLTAEPKSDSSFATKHWIFQPKSQLPVIAIGLTAIALFLTCWFTGLIPILTVQSLMASAQEAMYDRGQPSQAERDFRVAAEFDTWSAIPCERLSEMALQRWLAADREDSGIFERCRKWQVMAIERDPRNPGGYRFLGEIYLSKATREGDPAAAESAADAFQQAVALYPNHAVTQSQLAEALWKAGKVDPARDAARRARHLDQINEQAGHTDKRLSDARRRIIATILGQDSN